MQWVALRFQGFSGNTLVKVDRLALAPIRDSVSFAQFLVALLMAYIVAQQLRESHWPGVRMVQWQSSTGHGSGLLISGQTILVSWLKA